MQGYNTSLQLLAWLGANPKDQPPLYLGMPGFLESVRIARGFGYSGAIFCPAVRPDPAYEKYYKAALSDTTIRVFAEKAPLFTVCNPDFDERWTGSLPVTFVYVRGEHQPYYFGPETAFSDIQKFILERRKKILHPDNTK